MVGVPADLGLATTGHPGAASQKPDRTSHIRLRIVRTGSVSHSTSQLGAEFLVTSAPPGREGPSLAGESSRKEVRDNRQAVDEIALKRARPDTGR